MKQIREPVVAVAPAPVVRLTSMAHGGGCGCKLAPSVLTELLRGTARTSAFANLLVGNETGDDAAVWSTGDGLCIVATTDFFTPIVDDARDFGRVAATNAISDIYAMGASPVMALAILGMPLGKLANEIVRDILAGGDEACAAAGIPVAGGHSIDTPELIYGLAVIGTCRPEHVRRNSDGKPGDILLLTKPIGVGIYSAAFKKDVLAKKNYDEMIASTTTLNSVGKTLSHDPDVHAMTDVTGFGLLGHALEIARGSKLSVSIDLQSIPMLSEARALAKQGFVTGASKRNWSSYGHEVSLADGLSQTDIDLLTDPQTSGGLLISCAPAGVETVTRELQRAGCLVAAQVGRLGVGSPIISVR